MFEEPYLKARWHTAMQETVPPDGRRYVFTWYWPEETLSYDWQTYLDGAVAGKDYWDVLMLFAAPL